MLSAPSTVALNTAFICWHITMALLASVSDTGQNISIALSFCQNLLGQTTFSYLLLLQISLDVECKPFISLEDVTSTFDQIVKVSCGTVPSPGPSAQTEVTCQFSADWTGRVSHIYSRIWVI